MLPLKKLPTTIAFVTSLTSLTVTSLTVTSLTVAGLTSGLINILPSFTLPSLAQTLAQTLAPCVPPADGEFILLVITPTTASESQLKQVLPPTVTIPICDYQSNRVSRMGGFRNFSDANAWAEYINQSSGLQAFVVQAATSPPSPTPAPPTAPVSTSRPTSLSTSLGFSPQPLAAGFAVIVDFFNTPSIAAQLRSAQNSTPGLVSYGGQAYLLATYTADSGTAFANLQQLTGQGFQAFIVDSRQVMLLTDAVQIR